MYFDVLNVIAPHYRATLLVLVGTHLRSSSRADSLPSGRRQAAEDAKRVCRDLIARQEGSPPFTSEESVSVELLSCARLAAVWASSKSQLVLNPTTDAGLFERTRRRTSTLVVKSTTGTHLQPLPPSLPPAERSTSDDSLSGPNFISWISKALTELGNEW